MSTPEALWLAGRIEYPQFVLTPETRDAAATELRRQHAEIERLTAALDEARAERSVAYLAFEQVTKERDALRADAERYRWLRLRLQARQLASVTGSRRLAIEPIIGRSFLDSPIRHYERDEETSAALDAAIDRVRAQTKENGNG